MEVFVFFEFAYNYLVMTSTYGNGGEHWNPTLGRWGGQIEKARKKKKVRNSDSS